MDRWQLVLGGMLLFAAGALAAFADSTLSGSVIDLRDEVDLRIIGRKSLDHLGRSFAIGDFNNDGWSDLVVGADDSDPTGNVSGEVYVLFGDPTVSGIVDMAEHIPDMDMWGGTDEGRLGHNMTVADVNGDGLDDLVVLDYNAGPPDRHTAGTTHVFFGGTETWNRPLIDMTHESGDVVIWGAVDGEHAGAVYAVADVNNDGLDDLVLGAPASDRGVERVVNSGAVYVLHGRRDLAGSIDLLTDADLTIRGIEPAGLLGSSLGLRDVDGDGTIDLVVGLKGLDRGGAIDVGAVYVFLSIPEMGGVVDLRDHDPDVVLWGAARERVGSALAVGDVNGDGQADLLIGAPTASRDGRYRAGVAYLMLGPLDTDEAEIDLPAAVDMTIWGPAANARAGEAVALWDLGGDGLAEVLVNVSEADVSGRSTAGLLAIWYGRRSFEAAVVDLAVDEPDIVIWGEDPFTRGAWYLQGTGDLDNNGHPDLLMGIADTQPVGRQDAGTIYGLFNLVPAQPTPLPSLPPTPLATATSTATATLPASATPTATLTFTLTATALPTSTPTPPSTPAEAATPSPSPSSTPTASLTSTTTQTPSPTLTATANATPAPTPVVYLALILRD
ncbi:MAG: hypothetical protein ACE5LU_04550 [Anaerolineae bacterium]